MPTQKTLPAGQTDRVLVAARPGRVLVKAIVGLVVLAGLGAGGYALMNAQGTSGPSASEAELFTVAPMSFQVTTTANGELKAKQQTELNNTMENEAAIVEIVAEGSFVKEGEVLCTLATDDVQKLLDEEMLSLESAKADMVSAVNAYEIQVSDNESTIRKALVKVELAELDLQKWLQGDVAEKRKELALGVEKSEREVERLRKKVEQSRQLHTRQFLSTNELEIDERDFVEATSNLDTAKLKQSVYEEFTYKQEEKKYRSELDESKAELERAKRKAETELASKEADRANKRQQLAIRERKVDKLKVQIEAATIKAPTGGLVVYSSSIKPEWHWDQRGPIKVGRKVSPNEGIIVLPDTSEMVASIKIHESLIGQVRPGQEALVTIDAKQGKTFAGKVEEIGIMAESGGWRDPNLREYEVKIALITGEGVHGLKPSMRCEARVVQHEVKDVMAVPLQAVFTEGPVQYVYQEMGGRFARTPLKIGRRSDTHAEVVAGLKGSESILLRTPEPGRVIKGDFDPTVLAELGISLDDKKGPRGARVIAASNTPGAAAGAAQADNAATETATAEAKEDEADGVEAEPATTTEGEGEATTKPAAAADTQASATPKEGAKK